MSFRVLAWAQSVRTGSASTKAVLMAIAAIVNDDGEGFPSQQRIADDSELSIRSVKRAMDELETAGVLTRERRYREGGYRTSDAIKIDTSKTAFLGAKKSRDTMSGDTVSNLRCHSGLAEPVNEPVSRERTGAREDLELAFSEFVQVAEDCGLPKPQALTPERSKKLSSRLAEAGGLDGWRVAIGKIRGSPFLNGQKTDFKATFDFVLQKSSFRKLMEGNYDATGAKAGGQSTPRKGSILDQFLNG